MMNWKNQSVCLWRDYQEYSNLLSLIVLMPFTHNQEIFPWTFFLSNTKNRYRYLYVHLAFLIIYVLPLRIKETSVNSLKGNFRHGHSLHNSLKQGCGFASLYCGSGSEFFTLARIRIQIRILLLIKMMQISVHHWSTYPPRLHYFPASASNVSVHGPSKAPEFWLYMDPAFHYNVDPDPEPTSQKFATPPKRECSLFVYIFA